MTQALYAHMNNKTIKNKKILKSHATFVSGLQQQTFIPNQGRLSLTNSLLDLSVE
jgi:hypothetical protein